MVVQTIKTQFDIGTKGIDLLTLDLVSTIQKLVEYPVQPIKNTSIKSLFPEKVETPKEKPKVIRRHVGVKTTPGGKIRGVKKEKEDIFDMRLRLYREYIKER